MHSVAEKKQKSQNLNHISYPYPDLRKNEKKKNLPMVVLSMSVSLFLCAPLGYRCRFEWYNSGNGTDGGGAGTNSVSFFCIARFFFSSFPISVLQASVLRVFIRGETEVRVSLTFNWEYIVWVCVFMKTMTLQTHRTVF